MSLRAGHRQAVLLAVFLIISLVMAASAACPPTKLVVPQSAVTIDNPGALTPGMAVVMSVRVDFPDKENTTYPETSQLELMTGLDSPAWTWNIVRNGVKKDETGEWKSRVIISGDVLSWPANTTESLDIELYGIAPAVMETKNLTVLRVLDVTSTACDATVYQYNAYVLNTTVTRERMDRLSAGLAMLRADAAAKERAGAGISPVMEKIDEAQKSLDKANATPVFEFVSVSMALDSAEAAIADGRRLLEEKPVAGNVPPQQAGTTVQKELPDTSQTPASPEPAPVLTGIIACLSAAGILKRRAHR